jgi:hypothetical protein
MYMNWKDKAQDLQKQEWGVQQTTEQDSLITANTKL